MSTQIETAQASPLPQRLRDAIVREAGRAADAIESGMPVERTALLLGPGGTWRLPLPPSDDPSVGTPMGWAMSLVLATEFVLTLPDAFADSGPVAVIGMSKNFEAAICIPHEGKSTRFRLEESASATMRGWLPKKYLELTADDADLLQYAFGPGGPLELTPESFPETQLNARVQ